MRHFAWSLSVGVLTGLGVGPFFASAAYAQRGGGGVHFGNAIPGSPLAGQQQLLYGNPMYGNASSPGSISPTLGGVNGVGEVVGGSLNGGIYGSPGSINAGIGGVNGSGAVVGGAFNGGFYGSPGSMSTGIGGVTGTGELIGGSQNGGIYGSPGSISPGYGGVNGNGAVVGGPLNRGAYGSPGSFSPSIGGVNGRGAMVGGSLNSGAGRSPTGGFGGGEFNGGRGSGLSRPVPIGITGPNFFPGGSTFANTENAYTNNYALGTTDNYNYNSAPNGLGGYSSAPSMGDDQSAAEGRFEYPWW
jgi:hypothetical protein